MAQSRYYSATAQPTVLTSSVGPANTTIVVQQVVGFPVSVPYILALDYNSPSEEIVLVTAQAGTSLTVTRAYDGTSAASHNTAAAVRHTWTALDGNDSRAHEAAINNVHGVTGNVVGTTDIQTLTNKTIQSPVFTGTVTLNSPIINGTITGNPAVSAPSGTALTVQSGATGVNPLTVKAFAGQTAALQLWTDSLGAQLAFISATGRLQVQPADTTVIPLTVNSPNATGQDNSRFNINGVTQAKITNQGFFALTPTVGTSGTVDLVNAPSGFTGNLLDLQLNAASKFKVTQTGAVTSTGTMQATGMASAYVENTTATSTSSTSYTATGTVVSTTTVVPPSGKVQVMGRSQMFQNTTAAALFCTLVVTGSTSGTLRAAADATALKYNADNAGNNGSVPGHESFIITGVAGETLTITWQHRVSSGSGSMDYRSITAVPLLG